jgi:integrase
MTTKKGGRPKKQYYDDTTGEIVEGLSYDSKNNSWFYRYKNKKGKWKKQSLGSHKPTAIIKIAQFKEKQKGEKYYPIDKELVKEDRVTVSGPEGETHDVSHLSRRGDMEVRRYQETLKKSGIDLKYFHDIPESYICQRAADIIASDTDKFNRLSGIKVKVLDYLDVVPCPLSSLYAIYLRNSNGGDREHRAVKRSWDKFIEIISPKKDLKDLNLTDIQTYKDTILEEVKMEEYKDSWVVKHFARVKAVFNSFYDNGTSHRTTIKAIMPDFKRLQYKDNSTANPIPIDRKDLHLLLSEADTKMRCMLMLGINAAYYAVDIANIRKKNLKTKGGLKCMDFPRTKNRNIRINVLWDRTVNLLEELEEIEENGTPYIFVNRYGRQFNVQDIQRRFVTLRKKAGVSEDVKFSHLRDGAATALFGEVFDEQQKVILGHKIRDERAKYMRAKPSKVKACSDVIYKEYFG